MKEYMISIIGGAVLASLAHTVSPEKWTKYIKIITGLMIISIIISPGARLMKIDIFKDFDISAEFDADAQKKAVISEMENKISEDITKRIQDEFSQNIQSEVTLSVNNDYEIEGVNEIRIWKAINKAEIENRLKEVYSPSKILFLN